MDPIVTSSMISTALAKLLDSTATQAGSKLHGLAASRPHGRRDGRSC